MSRFFVLTVDVILRVAGLAGAAAILIEVSPPVPAIEEGNNDGPPNRTVPEAPETR